MTRLRLDELLDHSKSRLATRLVLIALASYANEDGFAWPGMNKLMDRAKLRRSTVWVSLQTLRGMGEIALHDGPVPGRKHPVRTYTWRITVSGFGPHDVATDRDTVSGFGPHVNAQLPAPDSYFGHQRSEVRTSGVRNTRPPVDLVSFQDSDEEENLKGTIKNRYSEERPANANRISLDDVDQGIRSLVPGTEVPRTQPPDVESPDGVTANEVPAAEDDERRAELLDQAEYDLREVERCAGPADGPRELRKTLQSVGWTDADGGVKAWLRRQTSQKLVEIIVAAKHDQQQSRRDDRGRPRRDGA